MSTSRSRTCAARRPAVRSRRRSTPVTGTDARPRSGELRAHARVDHVGVVGVALDECRGERAERDHRRVRGAQLVEHVAHEHAAEALARVAVLDLRVRDDQACAGGAVVDPAEEALAVVQLEAALALVVRHRHPREGTSRFPWSPARGLTGAHGISAWSRVPRPGGLSSDSVPSSAATRSASPRRPDPRATSAPPTPSSATSTVTWPFARRTATVASVACAYFATFVSASDTTK